MHIEHVAIWTKDLEKMKEFYEHYFNVTSTELYHNKRPALNLILSALNLAAAWS